MSTWEAEADSWLEEHGLSARLLMRGRVKCNKKRPQVEYAEG